MQKSQKLNKRLNRRFRRTVQKYKVRPGTRDIRTQTALDQKIKRYEKDMNGYTKID